MPSEHGSVGTHSDSNTLAISALRTGGSIGDCDETIAIGTLPHGNGLLILDGVRVAPEEEFARLTAHRTVVVA